MTAPRGFPARWRGVKKMALCHVVDRPRGGPGGWAPWASGAPTSVSPCGTSYAPVLDPANFVAVIDNPYFPLPVGRTLVYTGIKDGQTQTDTVIVTNQTKVILGITATVVSDIATHNGTVLERTFDFYAQDDQ